jgi:outer membrane protein OmpA-like peptidoglycan-associated protein
MKTKVIFSIIALSTSLLFAQEKVADKFFDNYAYLRAAELYQEAAEKGKESKHVLTRLGDCYYNNSDSKQAAIWYAKALEMYDDINPEYIYKYIQTQRSLANYQEADKWLVKFQAILNDDSRTQDLAASNINIYQELESTDGVFVEVENLDLNTNYSDFGSFIFNDKLYFASSRNTENDIYKWNNEPYLDLFQADVSTNEERKKEFTNIASVAFEGIDKKDIHDANATITKDGQTMYFTRDNVNKRNKKIYDKKGTTHLKIYKATLKDSLWSEVTELPFNDNVFSTGHPALSPDNKTLYFVSDRDGGLGQTDIYSVAINEDGTYGEPINLGEKINTEGREVFPFVAKDSTLYFSSDGFLNLGLLDIFKSNFIKDQQANAVNLGAPYNSGYDDFAYFVDPKDEAGYFSSNRPDGKGSDDIYGFSTYQCQQAIKGTVRDSKTLEPLANANVQLIDKESGKILEQVTSNEAGEYTFETKAECDKTYKILGSKDDYKDDLQELTTTNENDKENTVDLNLIPLINQGEIVINPIFFDFDKWDVRPDAAYELENIVAVMRAHPEMVIKIESHTDSRGSDRYNMKLSDRRAKSTRDYLYSRDIAQPRIQTAIGYGESQLVNECANGVKCSKEKHQENRRSKFIIVSSEDNN